MLDGPRGEHSIAELCCSEGIAESLLLQLVEGVPGRRQAEAGRGYSTSSDQQRGQGPATGSQGAEASRRRAGPGIAVANKA